MSQEPEEDDLLPEYDFSNAVRGKYYERYRQGTNPSRRQNEKTTAIPG